MRILELRLQGRIPKTDVSGLNAKHQSKYPLRNVFQKFDADHVKHILKSKCRRLTDMQIHEAYFYIRLIFIVVVISILIYLVFYPSKTA